VSLRWLSALGVALAMTVATAWYLAGSLGERRQMRALGYQGKAENFNEEFLQQYVRAGMRPEQVYRVLNRGATVRYFLESGVNRDSSLVQWFDYSPWPGGPFVAVIYTQIDGTKSPKVTTVYTESFGTSRARRLSEEEASVLLQWNVRAAGRLDSPQERRESVR